MVLLIIGGIFSLGEGIFIESVYSSVSSVHMNSKTVEK